MLKKSKEPPKEYGRAKGATTLYEAIANEVTDVKNHLIKGLSS